MNEPAALLKSRTGETMVLNGVVATGSVRGLLFELTVEQRYTNPYRRNVEVVYTFPLPFEGVLLDLEVEIGGRKLCAAVVERREAEEAYEEAVGKGDTPIMLERSGDGLCTLNLGSLLAGESALIRYRYAQLLRFEQGTVRVSVPTVIAPRYGDPGDAGLLPHQMPGTDITAAYPFEIGIDLFGELARGTIASPTHPIALGPIEGGARVSLGRTAFLDRDFVIEIGGLAGRSLVTTSNDDDQTVVLASFVADLPADWKPAPLALKFLVDCSGSMAGDSIEAARRAMHAILASLDEGDRFTISRFGSNVVHELGRMTPAQEHEVRRAAEIVSQIDADLGGTKMESALRATFALGSRDEAADILLITDGQVWDAPGIIEAAKAANQRVFAIGIGVAAVEGVLRRIAEATGGACEFVAPGEDASAAIVRMFRRMRSPRVVDVSVQWPVQPAWTLPLAGGLFAGDTVHAWAAFDGAVGGVAKLSLRGAGAAMVEASGVIERGLSEGGVSARNTLARVAAAKRIAYADEAEQLSLALRYGLLTDRTNLLVIAERAEGEKALALPELAKVAQMLPAGWGGTGSVVAMRAMIAFGKFDGPASMASWAASVPLLESLGTGWPPSDDATTFEASIRRFLKNLDTRARDASLVTPLSLDELVGLGLPEVLHQVAVELRASGTDDATVVATLLLQLSRIEETSAGTVTLPVRTRAWMQKIAGPEPDDDAWRAAMSRWEEAIREALVGAETTEGSRL